MKLLVTGGLGHIGSHILQNVNKIKKIKKLYIIDSLLSNRFNALFKLKKKKAKIFFIKKNKGNMVKLDILIANNFCNCIYCIVCSKLNTENIAARKYDHPGFAMS